MNHPGIIVNSRANWRQFLPRTVLEAVAYFIQVAAVCGATVAFIWYGGAFLQLIMGVER